MPGSLDPNVNGAYATDAAGLARVYDGTGIDPFADGSKGDTVRDLTTVIDGVISVKDASQFGRTDVYHRRPARRGPLAGDQSRQPVGGRQPVLRQADRPSTIISIKNGGGIRDSIGSFGAAGEELPPAANPDANKQAGEISQLDIENSLRFNNALSLVTLTPQQLLEALENGVSNPGGIFAQVGGLRFSYDSDPAGRRPRPFGRHRRRGRRGDRRRRRERRCGCGRPAAIRMVTLSFLIGAATAVTPPPRSGSNRPDGFRFAEYIAANPAFANRVDLDPDSSGADDVAARTGVATFTDNGREQDALAEYLANEHTFIRSTRRIRRIARRTHPEPGRAQGHRPQRCDDRWLVRYRLLNGTDGNDTINELGGNDFVRAGLGDDNIDGGHRRRHRGLQCRLQHRPGVIENGNIVIVSAEGRDTVKNFEHFQFTRRPIDVNDGNPLVDDLFYFARNKDVWDARVDADAHYNAVGWKEGRDPNPEFSTKGYLSANPDVKAAGINPLLHYRPVRLE